MCEVPFPGQSGMNYSRSRKNALHRKKFHVLMMLCVMFQTILEGVHLKVDCFIQKIILRILLHLLDCVSILIDIELKGGNDIYPPHPRNGILNREKKKTGVREMIQQLKLLTVIAQDPIQFPEHCHQTLSC